MRKTSGEAAAGPRRSRGLLAAAFAVLLQPAGAHANADAPARFFPAPPRNIDATSLAKWLLTNTDIQPSAVVYMSKDLAMVMWEKRSPTVLKGPRVDVVVRREALSDEAATLIGGRSELVIVELDCAAAQYRVRGAEIYDGNALTGSARPLEAGVRMMKTLPNSDMSALLNAACDASYKPLLPAPAGPVPTLAKPSQATAARLKLRPRVMAPSVTKTSQPSPLMAISVQVTAADSASQARQTMADITRRFPQAAGRPTRIEAARVNGKVFFGASIGGFASRREAAAFCLELKSVGRDCWVR